LYYQNTLFPFISSILSDQFLGLQNSISKHPFIVISLEYVVEKSHNVAAFMLYGLSIYESHVGGVVYCSRVNDPLRTEKKTSFRATLI